MAKPEEVSHFEKYPGYLREMFNLRFSTYSLRGGNILSLPKVSTILYGHSFSYLAAKNAFSDNYRTPVENYGNREKWLKSTNFHSHTVKGVQDKFRWGAT